MDYEILRTAHQYLANNKEIISNISDIVLFACFGFFLYSNHKFLKVIDRLDEGDRQKPSKLPEITQNSQ